MVNASEDKYVKRSNHMENNNSEKYSRGRRGAPAKGVGWATGARVQIPLSPLHFPNDYFFTVLSRGQKINQKKLLTRNDNYDMINTRWGKRSGRFLQEANEPKTKIKKVVDKHKRL